MLTYDVHTKGTTGTGRQYIDGLSEATRLEVEFEVEAVGGTPTVTFQIEGLLPNTDPTVAANWVKLAYVTEDATVATSSAAITKTAVGKSRYYVDGLDKRFFRAYAVNVTANTNVTYSSRLNRQDHP